MSNVSGIYPKGWRVLVLPEEIEEKTESGIIISHGTLKDREEMANTTGVVIAVGDACWPDSSEPWAKEGDKVVFGKFSGLLYVGKDEKKYRIINDVDIVAVLDEDVSIVDPNLVVKKGAK